MGQTAATEATADTAVGTPPPSRRRARARHGVARRVQTRRTLAALTAHARWEVLPLADVTDRLAALPPGARVPVTCSPKLGVEATVEVATQLAWRGFHPTPHLAARQITSHAHLTGLLAQLADAGIDDLFVVGGDATQPAGPFADGLALLHAITATGHPFAHIGIPAYPEGHHRIDDTTLWHALRAKQPHATYAVTQMCFDSQAICGWLATARHHGITLPVYAGVPGVVDPASLLRISRRIGIGDSLRFARTNRQALRGLLRAKGYRPEPLLRGLAQQMRHGHCDLAGLHIYTFNRIQPTVRHIQALHRQATTDKKIKEPS